MRKILAVLIGLALVPSAQATTLNATVKATPSKAGTAKRPQGVKLTVNMDLSTPDDAVRPIVTGFEVWHGPGLAFDRGKGYAECRLAVLGRLGPDGCPKASVLGSSGTFIEDPVEAAPKFVFLNGPGRRPLAYMTLQRPARVRAAIQATVVDNPRSAWPHRTSWPIPPSMQVVAGIPVTLNSLRLTYGLTKAAPLYVSSTSCPKGGWRWRVRVYTDRTAPMQQDGRVPCSARR